MVGFEKEQAIRDGAYFKWEQAGRPITDGVEFWLQAEHEFSASGWGDAPNAEESCCAPGCCESSSGVATVTDPAQSEPPRMQPAFFGDANQSQTFQNGQGQAIAELTGELTGLEAAMDSLSEETPEEFQQDSRSSRRSRRRTI